MDESPISRMPRMKTDRGHFFVRIRALCGLITVILLAGCCVGCGAGDKNPRYKVSGKVSYQGQPVEEGTITFEDPTTGEVNSSPLAGGGAYAVELPAGDYKVSVSPPLIEAKGTGDSPPDMVPKKANNIPKRYWIQETSALSAEVSKDQRAFAFDLKP